MAGNAKARGGRSGRRWSTAAWIVAAIMLLLPLVAMQLSDEVAWDLADFVIVGAMLFVACGTFELATRRKGNGAYQAAAGVAVAGAVVLVWVNLAVGIIGTEGNPANLMFGGVLAVGVIGAVIARFQPQGMARAMVATALAQAVATVLALTLGSLEGFVLSGFFVALWLSSAWLFRKADGRRPTQIAPRAA